jgi:hypothetical protein
MKLLNILLVPCNSAGNIYSKFKKRMVFHTILETAKLVFIVLAAVFFLMEYLLPFVQTTLHVNLPARVFSMTKSGQDANVKEVLTLARMIRLITDHQVPESKALRYAGLICHASQKYEVNPLEIIALIMAESCFKESSINKETGDYGLGQINWEHWGKDYRYSPQDLLDPSVNIFLTCHVYKFWGKDFGKYHRGNGIQSRAYIVNVKGILSTLHAYGANKRIEINLRG